MKEGEGTYKFKNGMKYVGHFKKDKKDGFGELTDANGKVVFQGIWKDDKQYK